MAIDQWNAFIANLILSFYQKNNELDANGEK